MVLWRGSLEHERALFNPNWKTFDHCASSHDSLAPSAKSMAHDHGHLPEIGG